MTKKSILRDQFSWKVRNFSHARSYFRSKAQRKTRFPLVLCSLIRNFAQNLCENGLHLGKERALCTRFAPSLSHAFSQRHHFILLNYPTELRPRKGFNEQNQISIGAAHHSADSTIADLGLSQAWQDIWDGSALSLCPYRQCSPLPDFDERIIKQP